jgi:hypothetical protein
MKKLDSHRMDFNKACYLGFFDLEDPGVDGRIILKLTCERLDGGAWTGSIWLRIGTSGGLL